MLVTPAAEQPSRRAHAWLTCNVRQKMDRYEIPDDKARVSLGRIALVIVPVLLLGAGMAPIGLAVLTHGPKVFRYLIIPFWILVVVSAGYALGSKNLPRSNKVIFALWAGALLNLGGCGMIWAQLGRIDG